MEKTWIIEKDQEEREDETNQILLDSAINTIQVGRISPTIQILRDIVESYPE